jgi:hypothetical protein
MYRTYVLGAIRRSLPKAEAVALGIEEFGAKPALKGKRAEDLMDRRFFKSSKKKGFFAMSLQITAGTPSRV